jgi:hypothetical protein
MLYLPTSVQWGSHVSLRQIYTPICQLISDNTISQWRRYSITFPRNVQWYLDLGLLTPRPAFHLEAGYREQQSKNRTLDVVEDPPLFQEMMHE